MRGSGILYFMLKDHLGSTSIQTDSIGNVVGDQRYYPFGETRILTGSMYTNRLFTGQREMTGSGIYYYGARFYSPKLGRFLSADTIVPSYADPQALNRYSYVLNNPLRYTDPTGHKPCGDGEDTDCDGHKQDPNQNPHPHNPPDPQKNQNNNKNNGCGQQGNYSPKCPGWHFYTSTYLVCPAELHCTIEEMIDYLSRFAFPGQYPSNPVRNTDINPVGLGPLSLGPIELGPYSMGPLGEIQTFISNGGLTVKNVTQPGHIFYDGIIIRTVYKDENGDWYVSTYGYGNNVNPGMDTANQVFGPGIFHAANQRMESVIEAHH